MFKLIFTSSLGPRLTLTHLPPEPDDGRPALTPRFSETRFVTALQPCDWPTGARSHVLCPRTSSFASHRSQGCSHPPPPKLTASTQHEEILHGTGSDAWDGELDPITSLILPTKSCSLHSTGRSSCTGTELQRHISLTVLSIKYINVCKGILMHVYRKLINIVF